MWVMLSDSYISAVAYVVTPPQPDKLLIRSRVRGDIERLFPGVTVKRTPDADYMFRAVVTRAAMAAVMANEIGKIDYPNFKDSVKENDRHNAYLKCWTAMMSFQNQRDFAERPVTVTGRHKDNSESYVKWWQRDFDPSVMETEFDDWQHGDYRSTELRTWIHEGENSGFASELPEFLDTGLGLRRVQTPKKSRKVQQGAGGKLKVGKRNPKKA